MVLLKGQKGLMTALAAAAGGAAAFGFFYPYTRNVVLTNMQVDEADAFTVKKIEAAYKKLQQASDCNSLLKKYLTKEVLDELKYRRTRLGASLYDVIQSGVSNLDSQVGVYAADVESYKTFAPLFDPIIEEYHGFPKNAKQPPVDLGEGRVTQFPPLDPEGKYITSTSISYNRTLSGYPFNPLLRPDDYLIVQQKVIEALKNIDDKELKGAYFKLDEISQDAQKELVKSHFLFDQGDRFLQGAKASKHWPKGRGVYSNGNQTFLVWINEEDHIKIISAQEGSNVGQVLCRLIRGVKAIEEKINFTRDERLGWVTFNPINLGSAIDASVHIYLPKLSARADFKDICEKLNLQLRGVRGDKSKTKGSVCIISNKKRLGVSEYEAIKQMYDGVKELIRLEKQSK